MQIMKVEEIYSRTSSSLKVNPSSNFPLIGYLEKKNSSKLIYQNELKLRGAKL